jgi:copper chaperone CopZ
MQSQFTIQNLKCGGCANTITKGVDSVEGVSNVHVDIEKSVVSFDYENDENLQLIHDKLAHLGYPVENDENSLFQKAKSYASCMIGRVTKE